MRPITTRTKPNLDQWACAIGLYIINFGMLDLLVQDFLESILPADEFSRLRDGHFQDRIKRIKHHVTRAEQPPQKRQALAHFFDRSFAVSQF